MNPCKKVYIQVLLFCVLAVTVCVALAGCKTGEDEGATVLRIASWEEYLDEGGWHEEEKIDLEDGTEIFGETHMVEEFESWYEETYGEKVRVEYSTFGTNEDLYNQMTLGDTFDLVCPSEYMIMKLMQENKLEAFSEDFLDPERAENYYVRGLSPYIRNVFDELTIDGESLSRYGAGYMWGVMGIVYNPAVVSAEDVKHWSLLLDERYYKQITMKDSIRDSYIVALGILQEKELLSPTFRNVPDYSKRLKEKMNDTSAAMVDRAEEILDRMRNNAYSLEIESGKADMVTGKVVANMQWSGDGVYTMDQAEEDGLELSYAVPEECSNLWFDGFCMMKDGIGTDAKKKRAAEAFINYISRPDNVIRNMYYVGYTSVIAGGESDLIYQYADWCYGAEEEDEDTKGYSMDYFFAEPENRKGDYVLEVPADQITRQVCARYPSEEVIRRSAVMECFDEEANKRISRMWINIRCWH